MFKYFVRLIFIILISSIGKLYSQSRADTTDVVTQRDSLMADSITIVKDSTSVQSESASTVNEDSLYMPVRDSAYPSIFTRRKVSTDKIDHYLSAPEYEYANDPEYWKKNRTTEDSGAFSFLNFFRKKAIQWIFFLCVTAIIFYGIYFLTMENNFKWLKKKSSSAGSGFPLSASERPPDYEDAINKHQAEGNYRMAVRNMYLRLIHSLNAKNIILIKDSFTNSEMMDAFGAHPLAAEFRFLATAYEYVFYGEFILTPEIFTGLKTRFDIFQQKLPV